MENLFDKIKPEVLISIYEDQHDFPYLVKSIIDALKSNFSIFDLKLKTATRIYTYAYPILDSFDETKFMKLFK